MLANNSKPDSWRKTLKLISHCPVCNNDYKSEAIKLCANESETEGHSVHGEVISHPVQGEAKFVHFTCGSCHSYFIAMVMTMAKGVSTVGMITDLSFQDVERLYKMPTITIDQVIEGRQFINSPDFKI